MSKNIAVISAHGAGDTINGFQVGDFISRQGHDVTNFVAVRDEVFKPIKYLFPEAVQIPEEWGANNAFLTNPSVALNFTEQFGDLRPFDEIIYTVPDLLFNNSKFGFDWKKYGAHPQSVRSRKLLTHLWKPEDVIYCSLNSSTPEYQLTGRVKNIISQIAIKNPTKRVYFNNLTVWNGTKIDNGDFSDLPENVVYFENQDFCESLEWLKKAEYVVTVDCGVLHMFNQMSDAYTLLDTRMTPAGFPWLVRWRSNLANSIDYRTDSVTIAELVKANIEVPQSSLLPRQIAMNLLGVDWNSALLIKES